jgi:hypothetical protein
MHSDQHFQSKQREILQKLNLEVNREPVALQAKGKHSIYTLFSKRQ